MAVAEAADIAVLKCSRSAGCGGPRGGRGVRAAVRGVVGAGDERRAGRGDRAGRGAAGAAYACGLGTGALLTADVVAHPLVPLDGWLPVPRRAPAPVPDPAWAAPADRVAWWAARHARVRALARYVALRPSPDRQVGAEAAAGRIGAPSRRSWSGGRSSSPGP